VANLLKLDGKGAPIGTPQAFIVHHTAGRGGVQGVLDTLRQRHLGVQYVMDRDGTIYQTGGPGESQMRRGSGAGSGLSNANTVGMEVIAKDDSDVTPAQVAAAKQFILSTYPGVNVFGHGEVNPGHKQATEGMSIVNALRNNTGVTLNSAPTQQVAAVPAAAPVAPAVEPPKSPLETAAIGLEDLVGAISKKPDPQVAAANAEITPASISNDAPIDPVMMQNFMANLKRKRPMGLSLTGFG
jgi:hypothetical protein